MNNINNVIRNDLTGKEYLEGFNPKKIIQNRLCFPLHQKLYLKIDLKELFLYPSEVIIRKFLCRQMELFLFYPSHSLSLLFRNLNEIYEIEIPFDQISRFHNVNNRQLEIDFFIGYYKSSFVYSNKGGGIPIPLHVIHYDPFLNSLKNVTRILCTPCDRVPVSSIWMFESGMRRLCFGQVCERREPLNINVNNQQVHDTSQVKFSKEKEISQTVPTELYITCVFNTYKRAIRYFSNDTFENILLLLKKRFHVDVKFLCYRNLENQIISIENEKDWKVLLWTLEKREEKDLNLYLVG
ncbi:hypothetical protein Glove_283g110 [Diversispora epigaea]|uniref:PB1 domain-containing protein n=1 Tax=Diversispora epigaea TaxID=1348612 RepID=A0A397I1R2_9GLOM|nr:hypothetical protein Glove_283g110 [Diversispora epigaea]